MKSLMSTQQRERRRRRPHKVQARDESMSKERKAITGLAKRSRYSGANNLPEDIWFHIHSLLPMRDSARVASVSHTFLRSWRHHPNLIFSKETLGLKQNACEGGDMARAFTSKVDQILKNHSGTGLKTLEFDIPVCHNVSSYHLNTWLQIGTTPGIESLTLKLPLKCINEGYSFPCSLLFGANGNSIQHLHLTSIAFHPPGGIDFLRRLTKLYLRQVRITEEELGCLLSNSFSLEQFELMSCTEIICLKIPCVERLSCVTVSDCNMLQMIESNAPNLSTFVFKGDLVQLSLGQSSQVKNLRMDCANDESNLLCYAITNLPYIVPKVETICLSSFGEMVNTPMVAGAKFLHLKYLEVYLDGDLSAGYDYLSLVSFLDASPVLETFMFGVEQDEKIFDSVFEDDSNMRQMPQHKHDSLKNVTILGFCSAKSMVELACHILENTSSLVEMQAGRVLPRTRRLSPHRKPAYPAPRTRVIEADHAALPAVPGGAASPHGCLAAGCLADFRDGERLHLRPPCLHAFHIDVRFQFQATANSPLCRGPPLLSLSLPMLSILLVP